MERTPLIKQYPKSVLKLLDTLRKEHYLSIDRLNAVQNFKAFDWDTYKIYAKEKFQITFTLAEKDITSTPRTATQANLSDYTTQKSKNAPRHLFLTVVLNHSRSTHRFLIKKPSTYLCQMMAEEPNNIYIASEVGIKLLHRKDGFEVIFVSTLKTAYRKIDKYIYDNFLSAKTRDIDTYSIGKEEREAHAAECIAKKKEVHPNNFEWDVTEYCEADGSICLQNLFRQHDYETTIIGHVFKIKKNQNKEESSSQIYLKLKDCSFVEGITLYIRCPKEKLAEASNIFKEGHKFCFNRTFKMISKSVNIYYTWMYNPRNLQILSQDDVDLKIQEKIAFDRINGSFIREIPLTIINRKKFKLSGYMISILNLRFDYRCRNCNQQWSKTDICTCRTPAPFIEASCFGLFEDCTGLAYITAKNERVLELLGLGFDDEERIKNYCSANGKVEFSKKDIDFYDKLRYGDLLSGISKQIELRTIIGISKCNANKSVDDEQSRKKTIIPIQMTERDKRLFVNGTVKRDFMDEKEDYKFIPCLKVVKVLPFDRIKECYNTLNYYNNISAVADPKQVQGPK